MTIHSEPPAGYTTARANDNEIVREALRILDQQLRATDEIFLTSPSTVRDYLCLQLVARECEIFADGDCQALCVCRSVWIERQESAMKH